MLAAAGIPVRLATRHWPTPVTAYAVRAPRRGRGRDGDREPQPGARQRLQGLRRDWFADHPAHRRRDQRAASTRPGRQSISRARPTPRSSRRLGDEAIAAYLDMAAAIIPSGPRELRVVYTPIHGVGGDRVPGVVGSGRIRAAVRRRRTRRTPMPTSPPRPSRTPKSLAFSISRSTSPAASAPTSCWPTIPTRIASRWPFPTATTGACSPATRSARCSCAHALANSSGDDRVVARSIVSSTWLDKIAAAAKVPARVTLTGFKWISRAGDADGRRLVFGYEEALGYAVTPRRARQGRPHRRARDGRPRGAWLRCRRTVGSRTTPTACTPPASGPCVSPMRRTRPPSPRDCVPSHRRCSVRRAVVRIVDYLGGADGLPPADLVALELDDGRAGTRAPIGHGTQGQVLLRGRRRPRAR